MIWQKKRLKKDKRKIFILFWYDSFEK